MVEVTCRFSSKDTQAIDAILAKKEKAPEAEKEKAFEAVFHRVSG